jgi:fructose-bisphosphate aldolase class I
MFDEMEQTIEALASSGRGILAADESFNTIAKRFATIGLESTEENRRDYRELLFTTPDLEQFISGVILFTETLEQKTPKGQPLPEVLAEKGIIPGIKVDKGLVNLPNSIEEKITQGLDGLPDRLAEYKQLGARFAKWRAVFSVDPLCPTEVAISSNSENLARYAAICQEQGIVPIVEPELLIEGEHDLEESLIASELVFHEVFHTLFKHDVSLEHMILKPSMVIPGQDCSQQEEIDSVAHATIQALLRTVPAAVPSINFLSGGQSVEQATAHLNRMNALYPNLPWNLSFSYGRALQEPALNSWQGKPENKQKAQKALYKRARLNGLAAQGQYQESMEQEGK